MMSPGWGRFSAMDTPAVSALNASVIASRAYVLRSTRLVARVLSRVLDMVLTGVFIDASFALACGRSADVITPQRRQTRLKRPEIAFALFRPYHNRVQHRGRQR